MPFGAQVSSTGVMHRGTHTSCRRLHVAGKVKWLVMMRRSWSAFVLVGVVLLLAGCQIEPPPDLDTDPEPLAMPTFVTVTPAPTGVVVGWRFDGDTEAGLEFELERAVDGGEFAALASVSGSTRSYLDSSTVVGVEYDYRVRAVAGTVVSVFSGAVTYLSRAVEVPVDAIEFVGSPGTNTGLLVPGDALRGAAVVSVSVSDEPREPVDRLQIGRAVRMTVAKVDLDLDSNASLYLAIPPTESRESAPEGVIRAVVRVGTNSGEIVEFPAVYTWDVLPIQVEMWWLRDIEANEGLPDVVEIEVVPVLTLAPEVAVSVAPHWSGGGAGGPRIEHLTGLHRLDGSATIEQMDDVCADKSRVEDFGAARGAFGATLTSLEGTSEVAWTEDVGRQPLVLVHGWQAVNHAHFDRKNKSANLAAALCGWRAFITAFYANTELSSRFTLYTFGYDSVNRRVASNAATLESTLQRAFGDTQVFAIAHSMGGLVVHDAIERGANVAQLYSLGTPFRGSAATECIEASDGYCTLITSVVHLIEGARWFIGDQTYSLGYPGTMDLAFEESFGPHTICDYGYGRVEDRYRYCPEVRFVANPYLQMMNAGGPSHPDRYTAFAGNIIGANGRLDRTLGLYGPPGEGAVQIFNQLGGRYSDYIVSVGSAAFTDLAEERHFSYSDLSRVGGYSSLGTVVLAPCLDHGRLTKEEHELLQAPWGSSCAEADSYPDGGTTVFGWIATDLMWRVGDTLPPGDGVLVASVLDAVTAVPIDDVMIDVCPAGGGCYSAFVDHGSDGLYTFALTAADGYAITFRKLGYLNATYANVAVAAGETTFLQQLLLIDEAYDVPAGASGRITDAFTGGGVAGADLGLRAGFGSTTGPLVATATTDGFGEFAFSNLDAGYYAAQVTRSGYVTATFSITVVGGQANANQNFSISPELAEDELRVVLTWGVSPRDLDSHLTGPMVDDPSGRFHVAFYDRNYVHDGRIYAQLDRDVVSSYGPETITIYEQVPGLYRYSVHDYTNRHETYSTGLANSGAQVRVYRGAMLIREFNVPSGHGTLWTVFELDGVALTPVNVMSYEAGPIDIQSVGGATDGGLLLSLPPK